MAIRATLSSPQLIPLQGNCNQTIAKVLYATYQNLDLLLSAGADVLRHSRIDDQILRLWVLLLIPALQAVDDCSSQFSPGESGSAWVKTLAAWIEAHAGQPLSLSDLERQSGYSRRSFQLAFRVHMGCSPMQWVSRCRMQKARQRLQSPAPGDSVGSVASGLGFVNVASFSRDFRRLFGERPSAVLRQARS